MNAQSGVLVEIVRLEVAGVHVLSDGTHVGLTTPTVPSVVLVAPLQPVGMNPGHTRRQQARGRRGIERQAEAPLRFLEGLDIGCDRRHVAPVVSESSPRLSAKPVRRIMGLS